MVQIFNSWRLLVLPAAFCMVIGAPTTALAQQKPDRPVVGAGSATSLSGSVQSSTGEPLPGATVFVRGTFIGTSTDGNGQFRLTIPAASRAGNESLTLEVSYVGYESLSAVVPLSEGQNLKLTLMASATMLEETVVSASRVQQTMAEAPVTIEKLNAVQISRISSPDIMVGLGALKGIDVSSSALLMSSVSTRGFNSAKSERVIQLSDYIDTQSPSLNVNAGNLLGIPEVDMESVDVLHGPSSALYGANAFNGVILFNSKDPFVYEGLTARIRGGSRDYADAQIRYAKKITPRLAAKLNLSYQQANDFMPVNFSAQDKLLEPTNNPEGSVFGYNAVNRYGDTNPVPLSSTSGFSVTIRDPATNQLVSPAPFVYMPGFTEQQLVADDNRTFGIRIQPTLSYLLTDKLKATAGYRFSRGTTTYQSTSRYRFKNLETQQFFGEVKSDKFFVRAYTTGDNGGDTYDLNFLGAFLQDQLVSDGSKTYKQAFVDTYNDEFRRARLEAAAANPQLTLAQQQAIAVPLAYAAASAQQLQPGSARFNELRNKIITDNTPGKGALIRPESRMSDISAQHQFTLPAKIGLIVGGAYRDFRLGSGGRLFSDTTGSRINNYEYGAYTQATKGFMENRLKLAFAGRIDFFKNFDPAFSPRASVTYALGKDLQHNFRASYSRAFRSPAQLDQFINLDLGRVYLLGNVAGGFNGYSLALRDAGLATVLTDETPEGRARQASFEVKLPALRLEQVNTVEVGYRAALSEKVSVDANAYFSRYNRFIGARRIFGNTDGTLPDDQQLLSNAANLFTNPNSKTRVVQAWTNADQDLDTRGASLGLNYAYSAAVNLTGSYSYNELTTTDLPADFQTFFNTPKHKFTLGVGGAIATDFSYGLSYRWAESFRYEMPFAVGQLAAPSSLDVNLGYHVQKLYTTFQAGATNVLDATNIQVYGAPSLGRIIFAGLLIDIK